MVATLTTILTLIIGYALYKRALKDKSKFGAVLGTTIITIAATYLWYLLGTTKEIVAILLFGAMFVSRSYLMMTTAIGMDRWTNTAIYAIYLTAFCLGYAL